MKLFLKVSDEQARDLENAVDRLVEDFRHDVERDYMEQEHLDRVEDLQNKLRKARGKDEA